MKIHFLKKILILSLGIIGSSFFITSCIKPKYRGPDAQVQMNWAFDRYAENLAKKQDLQLLIVGDVTDNPDIEYCLAMRSTKSMLYDEARPFAIGLVEDFWQMLHKDPTVRSFMQFRAKESPRSYSRKLLLENVGYKLAFWDKDVNRPLPPYIAEVLFVAETFYYYEADPQTQKLRLIHKESYDEAIQFYKKQEAVRTQLKNLQDKGK